MRKATIDVWQFIPEEDDPPIFMTYRFAGLVEGKPYCCEVSMEIDGRDCDLEHIWGHDIAPDQMFEEDWDAVLGAMSDNKSLYADMARRNEEY